MTTIQLNELDDIASRHFLAMTLYQDTYMNVIRNKIGPDFITFREQVQRNEKMYVWTTVIIFFVCVIAVILSVLGIVLEKLV